MSKYKVGYFVGSLSTSSINRLLAKALVRLAPTGIEMTEISIKDLGKPALWPECVHAQTLGGHRGLSGQDRHGHRAATLAQHPRLLQLAANEYCGGLHSVRARLDYR